MFSSSKGTILGNLWSTSWTPIKLCTFAESSEQPVTNSEQQWTSACRGYKEEGQDFEVSLNLLVQWRKVLKRLTPLAHEEFTFWKLYDFSQCCGRRPREKETAAKFGGKLKSWNILRWYREKCELRQKSWNIWKTDNCELWYYRYIEMPPASVKQKFFW